MTITSSIRATLVVVLAMIALSLGPVAWAQPEDDRVTWGIAPSGPDGPTADRPVFDLAVEKGAVIEDLVSISNYGYHDLTVQVYAHDAFTTDVGGMDVLPAADTSSDAGTWITVAREVTIPARSRADVPFTIRVPADAEPGDHAAGIVASVTFTEQASDGSQVALERRVGARVYIRVIGPLRPELTVEDVSAQFVPDARVLPVGEVQVSFTVRNTGNVRLGATTLLRLSAPWNVADWEQEGPDVHVLLPGETYSGTAVVDDVGALVHLDVEVDASPLPPDGVTYPAVLEPTTGHGHVWAVPWLVLALAALLVAHRLRRRYRRRSVARPRTRQASSTAPAPADEKVAAL